MLEDNSLDRIDNALLGKSSNERNAYYVVAFIAVAALIYFLLWDMSARFLSDNTRKLNDVTQKLATEKNYIAVNSPMINILKNGIQTNSTLLTQTQNTNNYLDIKLKELSYLLFNDQSWAGFMDRLTALAKQYNINIVSIENVFLDEANATNSTSANTARIAPQNQEVKQVLNIGINSVGNFHNVVRFLNAIEESQLVVDVYNSSMSSTHMSNNINSSIQLSVWGVLY